MDASGGGSFSAILIMAIIAALIAGAVLIALFLRWYKVYRRNGRK